MTFTTTSPTRLSEFAKYARPRPRYFFILSIVCELVYWLPVPWPLVSFFIVLMMPAFFIQLLTTPINSPQFQPLFPLFGMFFIGITTTMGRLRKKLRVDARGRLNKETRAPILYLRSFLYESLGQRNTSAEERKSRYYDKETDDEVLALTLRNVGPLITVGIPSDKLPPLGALRLYFEDEEWQTQVQALMSISQFVIVQPGYSDGTDWEIDRLKELCRPKAVIFSFLAWRRLDRESRQLEYEVFAMQIERIFGCKLPVKLGSAYFLEFDEEWRPRLRGLAGWKAYLFGIYWIPSVAWRGWATMYEFIAAMMPPGLHRFCLKLYARFAVPRICLGYSVPGVREALRPMLRERGVHLPIWRTIVFGTIVSLIAITIVSPFLNVIAGLLWLVMGFIEKILVAHG